MALAQSIFRVKAFDPTVFTAGLLSILKVFEQDHNFVPTLIVCDILLNHVKNDEILKTATRIKLSILERDAVAAAYRKTFEEDEPKGGQGEKSSGPNRGVHLEKISTKELMQELAGRKDYPAHSRQTLEWDIADFGRPRWEDKKEKPLQLPPELRYATAPTFLKIAWADVINKKGEIYKQRVRHYDKSLMTAVEKYMDNRKGTDPLQAEGLVLLTGKVPLEPSRPKSRAKAALHGSHA